MAEPRHFLDLDRLDAASLRAMIDHAARFRRGVDKARHLTGRTLAMVFEKPSTRTRVSFQVAMRQLGGDVALIEPSTSQLGRGETAADTARVLSRYCDAIMLRTGPEATLLEMAEAARVPVINALTDRTHPCQVMADVATYEQLKGPIAGARVAWVGDGGNVANSWIHAAARFGFSIHLACPAGFAPDRAACEWARAQGAGERVIVTDDIDEAVAGADCVVTDAWISMGDPEADAGRRRQALGPYQVNEAVMAKAKPDALFMHCLPAHRGEEVTDAVIDGPRSAVWDEVENRLHAQKAILVWCLAPVR